MTTDDKDLSPQGAVHYIEERNHLLRDIPYEVVRQGWFILSHLLLDEGARVAYMGCGEGQIAFVLAALNPKIRIIGVDKSKRNINKAKQTYKLHNLEYKLGDIASDLFKPETLDAVIDNHILHEVFSNARYNEQIISDTLRKHYKALKNNGLLFVRDYARPPPGEYVLMEMHDKKSRGQELPDLSEPDLLVWYSEHARPKQDPGCGGFFLEELPPRFPKTRLFRLPYKWAYEFMMRKDNREEWVNNLPFEYTFFTVPEFRRELRALGARIEYSAPHWDEDYIRKNFLGHFRLLQVNGEPMDDPPTSFIAIARKMPDRTSLDIKERRIAQDEEGTIKIKTFRDQKNGKLVDVASRDKEFAEILPYRISEDGWLSVFLHDGIARGLVNSVPRSGVNIDGREWSGHMVEPIAVEHQNIMEIDHKDKTDIAQFCKTFLGLKPQRDSTIEEGQNYYPDPTYIEERIHTYYLKVEAAQTPMPPKTRILQAHHFHAKGTIREFSAQLILDAIAVGLIPNARLELQILALMQHTKTKAENWISRDISIQRGEITKELKLREFLRQVNNSDNRFKQVRGNAGQLKTVNSIFVEEGHTHGARSGISSHTLDFAISDVNTINTAVVLPLTGSARGDLFAGFLVQHMPVPQRFEGKALTICAPQFNIPKEVTSTRMLKHFLAEKLNATPEMIIKLGESYFTHIGMTPHRIHPYALAAPPSFFKDPDTKFIPFFQYMLLWRSLSKQMHFMTVFARAYRFLPDHMKLAAKREVNLILDGIFQNAKPDWSVPVITPAMDEGSTSNKEKPIRGELNLKKEDPTDKEAHQIKDYYLRKEKERKERRERKRRGAEQNITDPDEEDDVYDSGDQAAMEIINKKRAASITPEMLEAVNKKLEAAKKLERKLIREFRKKIRMIKSLEKNEDHAPKPEKS